MLIDERTIEYLQSKDVDNVHNCIMYLFMQIHKLYDADLSISLKDKNISNTLLEVDIGVTNVAGVKLKKHKSISEESLEEAVTKIRNLFQGIRPYSMGDKHDLKRKLLRFVREYPEYTLDDIYAATEYYIEHTNPTYIRRANYFIFKTIGKSEVSDLLRTLAELKELGSIEKRIVFD